jgi:CRISPR/Cas system-associated endoribonuclease Cas2
VANESWRGLVRFDLQLTKYGIRQRRYLVIDIDQQSLRILDMRNRCKTEFPVVDILKIEVC